jgi:hypothetical protein
MLTELVPGVRTLGSASIAIHKLPYGDLAPRMFDPGSASQNGERMLYAAQAAH